MDKKEEQTPRQKKRLDFLDILLTAKDSEGRGLTDLEVRSEVDTFMFAGMCNLIWFHFSVRTENKSLAGTILGGVYN